MGVYAGVPKDGAKGWGKFYLPWLNGGSPVPLSMLLRQWTEREPGAAAVEAFRGTLRSLIDRWIDSGKSSGEERPWNRTIPLAPLNALVLRHPPHLEYRHSASGPNRLQFSMWPLGFQPNDDSIMAAQDAAGYFFLVLLQSSEATRLSRCDVCRRYFECTRKPKRYTVIYRGSFCLKHKGKGGAERTAESRKRRKNQLIELAAQWWTQWKPTRRHGKRSVWVANQVNQRLRRGANAITGKWITQNQTAIEAEVEQRNMLVKG